MSSVRIRLRNIELGRRRLLAESIGGLVSLLVIIAEGFLTLGSEQMTEPSVAAASLLGVLCLGAAIFGAFHERYPVTFLGSVLGLGISLVVQQALADTAAFDFLWTSLFVLATVFGSHESLQQQKRLRELDAELLAGGEITERDLTPYGRRSGRHQRVPKKQGLASDRWLVSVVGVVIVAGVITLVLADRRGSETGAVVHDEPVVPATPLDETLDSIAAAWNAVDDEGMLQHSLKGPEESTLDRFLQRRREKNDWADQHPQVTGRFVEGTKSLKVSYFETEAGDLIVKLVPREDAWRIRTVSTKDIDHWRRAPRSTPAESGD